MKITFKNLVTTAALALTAAGAMAQTPAPAGTNTPRVDQRQTNQEKRIDQGVATGALTRHETKRLTHEQNTIDRVENKAKSDGTVTAQERKRLHKMQNHASADIKHQKHDRQHVATTAPGN